MAFSRQFFFLCYHDTVLDDSCHGVSAPAIDGAAGGDGPASCTLSVYSQTLAPGTVPWPLRQEVGDDADAEDLVLSSSRAAN